MAKGVAAWVSSDVASRISAIKGIKKLAVTTNGYRLPDRAESYAAAGITAINISTDSLKSEKFHKITKHDRMLEVLDGITACQRGRVEPVATPVFDEGIECLDVAKCQRVLVRCD